MQKITAVAMTVALLAASMTVILQQGLAGDAEVTSSSLEWSSHDVGRNAPEPTIGVTSNGNIFVQALASAMRSTDGGDTWTDVSTFASSPTTFDPYLWVDPVVDRVYTVQLYVGCSYLSFSDDYGDTWVTNPAACGVPVNDHQKFATGRSALVDDAQPPLPRVGYYCSNQLTHTTCTSTHDGGATFKPGWSLIFHCGGLNGQPHVSPTTGTAFVPFSDCSSPGVGLTRNDGATWHRSRGPRTEGAVGSDPDLTVDDGGLVHMIYRGDDRVPYLITSEDDGRTWRGPYQAAPPGVTSSAFVTIASGDQGRIGVAAVATEDWSGDPTDAPSSAEWHLYAGISTDADQDPPTFQWSQVTPDVDPVQVGPICLEGLGCGGDRNLLDFIDSATGPDGRYHIAYADGCTASRSCKTGDAPSASRDSEGRVVILRSGPSLTAGSIADGNGAPTADFTTTQSGLEVTFDGTASTDPDGDTLDYYWTLGDGTESFQRSLTHTYDAAGTYTVTLTVSDGTSAATVTKDVDVASTGGGGGGGTTPGLFAASFEDGLPDGWRIEDPSGSGQWHNTTRFSFDGVRSMAISPYGPGEDDWLVTSPVDLAGTSAPQLSFQHIADGQVIGEPVTNLDVRDFGEVAVTTDDGATWDVLATNITTTSFWDNMTLDLSAYAGQEVKVGWHWTSDDLREEGGWRVDAVVVWES